MIEGDPSILKRPNLESNPAQTEYEIEFDEKDTRILKIEYDWNSKLATVSKLICGN